MAQAGWVDLALQTPHGFKRIQVKTTASESSSVRVRNLGADGELVPSDRYDILVVVNLHRLWVIPASALEARDTITLHTQDTDCPFAGYRER